MSTVSCANRSTCCKAVITVQTDWNKSVDTGEALQQVVSVIKNPDASNKFIDSGLMQEFVAEQNQLDKFIYHHHCGMNSPIAH